MTEKFQRYKDWSPTGFDSKGLNADEYDIREYLVMPVLQTRDSDALERSNFAQFVEGLGGESDTVQVHSFGHWANGWFEIILVSPNDPTATARAVELAERLEDYPILDECHYSELEYDEASEYWANMGTQERMEWCKRAEMSIFAARHSDLSMALLSDHSGRLYEYLTRP